MSPLESLNQMEEDHSTSGLLLRMKRILQLYYMDHFIWLQHIIASNLKKITTVFSNYNRPKARLVLAVRQ